MKFIKGIFYTLAVLVMALCAFVLICALNPNLSQSVAKVLYGDENATGIMDIFNKDKSEETSENTGTDVSNGDATGEDSSPVIIEIPENTSPTPSDMSKFTGYQPITPEEEKVTDEVAESIKKTLSTGETGEKFTFDATLYPFYQMLNDDEKAVYRQIYANALAVTSSFAPVKAITTTQLSNIFEAVVNDHPELFYLDTSYQVKYTKSGSVVEIQLVYYTLANALDTAKANFSAAAKAVIAGAQELDSDYAKEKYVHDYLVQNVTYADGAVLSQSAYSALVNGISVCAGYARANQYILQQLNIPCYYCTGYAGEDHAWNIVKLGEGYYNEDITWDDTNPSTYDYFNKTDKDFVSTHTRTGLSVNLPPCNATQYAGKETGTVANVEAGDPNNATDSSNFEPLKYEDLYPSNTGTTNGGTTTPGKSELVAALEKLGYKESDACWDMDQYYAECKKKLIAAGSGDQHFSVIIPSTLFKSIESAYGTGAYKEKYVNEALKSLGMTNFSIQIQAERMGSGFYRLYHNVVSWKEETTATTTTTDSTSTTTTTDSSTTTTNTGTNTSTTTTNTGTNTSTTTDTTNTNKNTNTNTNTNTSTTDTTNTNSNTNAGTQ